ncbi:MAG: CoA transferase [Pseudomonadota bacterium]
MAERREATARPAVGQGPLKGITVVDATVALAGPFGTAVLADLGANVIKIEAPEGDMSRGTPPFTENYVSARKGAGPDEIDYGGYFASINRNKRSLCLDLKNPAERDVVLELCDQADVFVENLRNGVMDRLGVGYETLKARNPKLVYGALRGFGDERTGRSPYTDRPAFDIVAQSMGGLVSITGEEGGLGVPCGSSVGDIYPGTLLALGIVSAVVHAQRTGEGQFFDVAMYDSILLLAETVIANYGFAGNSLEPRGAHHPLLCPFGVFPAADGGIAIAAPRPNQWEFLCEVIGRPDLVADDRTKNTLVRRKNQQLVEGVIAEWSSLRTRAEVVAALAGQVPCGPVNTAADIFVDPHVAVREMITELPVAGADGNAAIVGCPLKFTQTPSGYYRPPPKLDEHRSEILAEFGIKDPRP